MINEVDAILPPWSKTRGTAGAGQTVAEFCNGSRSLGDLPTPSLSLSRDAYRTNIRLMQDWVESLGMLLAPHGKTTMAPTLWNEQLAAGCWGITVATEAQLLFAIDCGVPNIQLANPLVRPAGIARVGELLARDPNLTIVTWVDSVDAVAALDAALPEASGLQVLVDVGSPGGRTGVRSPDEFERVVDAARRSTRVRLVGTSGYEGAITGTEGGESRAAIEDYIRTVAELHRSIVPVLPAGEAILSVGGTAQVDAVASALIGAGFPDASTRVILRSGVYIVHDDGYYAERLEAADSSFPRFESALHAWARVLSVPEEGLALIDAGRRDLPYDQDLPVVLSVYRGNEELTTPPMAVRGLNDQHGFVEVPAGVELRVGDVVRLGLSHPCSAFDRWAEIPVVDGQARPSAPLVDLVGTYF